MAESGGFKGETPGYLFTPDDQVLSLFSGLPGTHFFSLTRVLGLIRWFLCRLFIFVFRALFLVETVYHNGAHRCRHRNHDNPP